MKLRVIAAAAMAVATIGIGAGTAQAAQMPTPPITSHSVHQHKTGPSPRLILGDTYTVKMGDTLWRISVRAYGNKEHAGHHWKQIARANHIHGTKIRPGQVLVIPR